MKSIDRKASVVQERVERLKQLSRQTSSFDEYLASPTARDVAERNIQVAIEACLDIGKIIISAKSLREPPDNKGIFIVLAEAGVLGSESLRFLVPMAGTRNVLIHGYDKVDDALIYGVLKKHLDDFSTFLKEVKENYLDAIASDQIKTFSA